MKLQKWNKIQEKEVVIIFNVFWWLKLFYTEPKMRSALLNLDHLRIVIHEKNHCDQQTDIFKKMLKAAMSVTLPCCHHFWFCIQICSNQRCVQKHFKHLRLEPLEKLVNDWKAVTVLAKRYTPQMVDRILIMSMTIKTLKY